MATAQRKHKSLEHSMTILTGGHEPTIDKDRYRESLMTAINWYNANREEKDFRAYAEYYIKNSPELKDYIYAASKASFLEIKGIGVIARLIRRGQHIDINDMMKTLERLEAIKAKYPKTLSVEKKSAAVVSTAPVTIQERIAETASKFAADVDEQIDNFVVNPSASFSMKSFLVGNSVSGVVAKKIGSKYERLAQELDEALKGKDPQLKEGYGFLTKVQLRKFHELVRSIIADCNQQVVSAKVARKPKARKVKPPSVVAAKIKPMKEYPALKLTTIEPAKIIGADELWVYTPATRKLTVFRGADGGPLGVSGMSVTNYDVEKSETKTIRKPEVFFKGLTSFGKRAMANAWKAINAKGSKPRARINDEMILLAAN
jgi:hypothetical protein